MDHGKSWWGPHLGQCRLVQNSVGLRNIWEVKLVGLGDGLGVGEEKKAWPPTLGCNWMHCSVMERKGE